MTTIKPILKYPGAKWRLASWLQRYTPHAMRVVDAYCGSGAFALTLSYRPDHLILNDQDQYINLLFRCLREKRADLCAAVNFTPWSRAEYLEVSGPNGTILETGNLVEDARRFLICTWQAHGTTICTRNGWRHKGHKRIGRQLSDTYEQWQQLPERLAIAAAMLADAEIECLPALTVIGRYATENTLIYADPPYMRHTTHGHHKKLYRHEMTEADHADLIDALEAHPGPVMLSGYNSILYASRLTRWQKVETTTQAEKGNTRIECLWLNPACAEQLTVPEQEAMHL